MRKKTCLTTEDVHRMVAACKAKGAEIKRHPTIAIVDEAGHLLFLERPDCNGVNTVEMSIAKARTAAFGERIKEKPQFLMSPNYLGVEGGIPLLFEGECIGGVGVSGIDHDDEPVAEAGAAALKA
jgi:glc operon protein GlcG